MRVVGLLVALFVVGGVVTAQGPTPEPAGTLAQVMRSIFFPNSNIIFDVQARDPEAPPETAQDGTVTATFSSIYTGWPVVEHAAVALAEATNLLMFEGRQCQNGRPVPLEDDVFRQYAQEMQEVAIAAAEVARTRDRDAMMEATNDVAGACENCHMVYRRYPEENRCVQPPAQP